MRRGIVAVSLVGAGTALAQDVYRAGSSDPYWRIAIDARTIRFEEPRRRTIVVPRPVATTSTGGDRFESDEIVVDTTRANCSLGNSDRVYRDMVIVEVAGRTLRGCGNGATGAQINAMGVPAKRVPKRPPVAVAAAPNKSVPGHPSSPRPDPATSHQRAAAPPPAATAPVAQSPAAPLHLGTSRPILANTKWAVWKVREQEIGSGRPLTVSFSTGQVEGQLCNRFRGNYTLAGERLQAGSLASTRMACQGPAATAEQLLFAMLRQATRAVVSKWGTLTLGNGRETIMLRPAR